MTSRLAPAATFVGFALAAGVLQVIATIVLGLAEVDEVRAAAAEGSGHYVLGAFGAGLGMLAGWLLRRRPLIASIVFFVWELAIMLSVLSRASSVGLAYHGEYILHHFAALLAGAGCICVGWDWTRRAELGPARWLPATLVGLGAAGLLAMHVLPQPGIDVRSPRLVEYAVTFALLLSLPASLAVLWRKAGPPAYRLIAVALLVPLLLRVALAWPEGLSGASVPDDGRFALMSSVVLAAAICFVLFRPDAPRPIRVLVVVLSGLATGLLYLAYRRAFGALEDGVGGLVQSLFGFTLPYPTYVATWQVVVVSVALFCIFSCVYLGLMSWNERVRGLALGLLAVTGIGLSNPQLVLMAAAGHLLWIDSLVTPEPEPSTANPPSPVEDILAAVADRLGLPAPVVLEAADGTVVSIRGELGETHLDLRARPRRDRWSVRLEMGIIGRGRPDLELVPDPGSGGDRPAHLLSRTHRVRGQVRALERIGDEPLDALIPFPDARARFWDAGIVVDLGADLSNLDVDSLTALVESLTES